MKKLFFIFGGLFFSLMFFLTSVPAQANFPKPSKISKGAPIYFPQPPYPDEAREKKISGKVKVEVHIDEQGNVVSAQSISGHRLLRTAAEKAAKEAKFTPTLFEGVPIKVRAILGYKFIY